MLRLFWACIGVVACTSPLAADEVSLTEDKSSARFVINGQEFTIARNPDPAARLPDSHTLTSRACPPFCIQPASAGAGIATLGELELIAFLETQVSDTTGVLMDSRLPDFFAQGTIPGAVNVPFTILDASNTYLPDILQVLGAVDGAEGLDFAGALDLVLFCDGPWSDQSGRAIRGLLAAGYPPQKLRYYRGGMQDWLMLGLTVHVPQGDG